MNREVFEIFLNFVYTHMHYDLNLIIVKNKKQYLKAKLRTTKKLYLKCNYCTSIC